MPAVNNEYDDDEEYRAFEDYVDSSNKAAATAKSYRTTYRKLRKLLNKPIRDAAQDTVINVVSSAVENINSQQALLNIAIVVRAECFQMPTDLLVEQHLANHVCTRTTHGSPSTRTEHSYTSRAKAYGTRGTSHGRIVRVH